METRTLILFLLGLTISQSLGASIPLHIHFQDQSSSADVDIPVQVDDDASRTKRSGLVDVPAQLDDDVVRIKRSGSGSPDFFGYIKRGITGKISQIASASAGASAHFSKGSSGGGGGGGGGYYYPAPHDGPISYGTKSFDFWTLKKSILNTLVQAVKAINGGIIAIKGQLIKGGGAIISAKGRLISMKGEAIANVGKHIVMNSKLSPNPYHYGSKPEPEYSAPSGHSGALVHPSPSYGPPPAEYGPPPSAPSASAPPAGFPDHPPSTYGAPTASAYGPPIGPSGSAAPSQAYLPQKINGPYEAFKSKLKGAHAGIVILKKIPKGANYPTYPKEHYPTYPKEHYPTYPKENYSPYQGNYPTYPKDNYPTYPNLGYGPSASLASLPLQDERNKVVKPTVDITKTQLFTPDSPPSAPSSGPPSAPPTAPSSPSAPSAPSEVSGKPEPHPFFESSLKPISPPKAIYGSPIDAPPSSAPSAQNGPLAPFLPTLPPVTSPPGYVDESLLSNHGSDGIQQPDFNVNKPLSAYNQQDLLKNNNLYLSKIPAPFEINSFGGNFGGDNFQGQGAFPGPVKTDFQGALDSYAPTFSSTGSDLSNLQLKGLQQQGTIPNYEVVKSVSYELPVNKRQ